MLKLYNPQFTFMMETKLSKERIIVTRKKCGFINGLEVDAVGSRGGFYLAWTKGAKVSLKSYSPQHIDVEIKDGVLSLGLALHLLL